MPKRKRRIGILSFSNLLFDLWKILKLVNKKMNNSAYLMRDAMK